MENAIVGEGKGVEHAFIKQIKADPKKFGFTGNVDDAKALHKFAQTKAHDIALKTGYADAAGNEVRVKNPGKVAYELGFDDKGKITVTEKFGDKININNEGGEFEKDLEDYEYKKGAQSMEKENKVKPVEKPKGTDAEQPTRKPRKVTGGGLEDKEKISKTKARIEEKFNGNKVKTGGETIKTGTETLKTGGNKIELGTETLKTGETVIHTEGTKPPATASDIPREAIDPANEKRPKPTTSEIKTQPTPEPTPEEIKAKELSDKIKNDINKAEPAVENKKSIEGDNANNAPVEKKDTILDRKVGAEKTLFATEKGLPQEKLDEAFDVHKSKISTLYKGRSIREFNAQAGSGLATNYIGKDIDQTDPLVKYANTLAKKAGLKPNAVGDENLHTFLERCILQLTKEGKLEEIKNLKINLENK